MAQINSGQKGDPEPEYEQEIFIGYESGAIGMFKFVLADGDGPGQYKIDHHVLISPQRIITDLKTKHVLSMFPFQAKKVNPMEGDTEFKLAVGYYAPYIQTFDIMESSDGTGYLFVDQK